MAIEAEQIANELRQSVDSANGLSKRMKVRSLLSKFGYAKRSDANTGQITEALAAAGVAINPAIIRLGADWQLDIDDWIFLTPEATISQRQQHIDGATLPKDWNADGWFDRLAELNLRTEKEVEIKFIVPLLTRLGYTDEDRYDGMPCKASRGSKKTTLIIDFALHNVEETGLKGQVLLIAEAKKEDGLKRPTELDNAFRQAKDYAMWTQCRHLLVTDGRRIVGFEIMRGGHLDESPIFQCDRQDLKANFGKLYANFSKNALTRFYLRLVTAIEEAR